MPRPKGSKNKRKPSMDMADQIVPSIKPDPLMGQELHETVPMKPKDWREEYAEVKARMDKLNPKCARGGCLHERIDHYGECHKCSCVVFVAPD